MLDSFRPEVLEGERLDAKTLHAINPKLVMVSITGYGMANSDGITHDWAHKAGHDINFMAMSGVLDQLKTADSEQAMPNVQFADLAGGSDTAVIALLAAVAAVTRGKSPRCGQYDAQLVSASGHAKSDWKTGCQLFWQKPNRNGIS